MAAEPMGGQQHGLGGQPHRPSGKRHGPGGRRHPTPFRFARSGFIGYDRVLFFSDAVFAIAITLLAVDLRAHNDGHLDRTGLVGFGISFLVIALFWLGHHGIFRYIVALDRILIGINLLFLGIIALLPYPTALLEVAHGKHTAAVVFYAICVGAAGLGEFAIWQYATRPGSGLATSAASTVRLHYGLRIGRVPVVFLASIPVALAAPQDAPYVWIVIIVLGPVINRFFPEPDEPEPIRHQIPARGGESPD